MKNCKKIFLIYPFPFSFFLDGFQARLFNLFPLALLDWRIICDVFEIHSFIHRLKSSVHFKFEKLKITLVIQTTDTSCAENPILYNLQYIIEDSCLIHWDEEQNEVKERNELKKRERARRHNEKQKKKKKHF